MADSILEFKAPVEGDVRNMIAETLLGAHNQVVEAVTEFKEQGDVDDRQDEIIAEAEPVMPTAEQKQAKANGDENAFTIANYKALNAHFKEQAKRAEEAMIAMAYEEAKAGINADYDIDLGRARISSLRKDWAKALSAATEMLKMVGSLITEKNTDEDGKVTEELVAADQWGEIALKASSVPSIRAKRGTGGGNSSANSDGAKIRAWGKENGWADLSDRGPLPTELKDAYAEAHATSAE